MNNRQLCLLMLGSILLSMSACIYTAAAMPNGRLTGIVILYKYVHFSYLYHQAFYINL